MTRQEFLKEYRLKGEFTSQGGQIEALLDICVRQQQEINELKERIQVLEEARYIELLM